MKLNPYPSTSILEVFHCCYDGLLWYSDSVKSRPGLKSRLLPRFTLAHEAGMRVLL